MAHVEDLGESRFLVVVGKVVTRTQFHLLADKTEVKMKQRGH